VREGVTPDIRCSIMIVYEYLESLDERITECAKAEEGELTPWV